MNMWSLLLLQNCNWRSFRRYSLLICLQLSCNRELSLWALVSQSMLGTAQIANHQSTRFGRSVIPHWWVWSSNEADNQLLKKKAAKEDIQYDENEVKSVLEQALAVMPPNIKDYDVSTSGQLLFVFVFQGIKLTIRQNATPTQHVEGSPQSYWWKGSRCIQLDQYPRYHPGNVGKYEIPLPPTWWVNTPEN